MSSRSIGWGKRGISGRKAESCYMPIRALANAHKERSVIGVYDLQHPVMADDNCRSPDFGTATAVT